MVHYRAEQVGEGKTNQQTVEDQYTMFHVQFIKILREHVQIQMPGTVNGPNRTPTRYEKEEERKDNYLHLLNVVTCLCKYVEEGFAFIMCIAAAVLRSIPMMLCKVINFFWARYQFNTAQDVVISSLNSISRHIKTFYREIKFSNPPTKVLITDPVAWSVAAVKYKEKIIVTIIIWEWHLLPC